MNGSVSTIVGNKGSGWRDGPAATAILNAPLGVAFHPSGGGDVYIYKLLYRRITLVGPSLPLWGGTGNWGACCPVALHPGGGGGTRLLSSGFRLCEVAGAGGESLPAPSNRQLATDPVVLLPRRPRASGCTAEVGRRGCSLPAPSHRGATADPAVLLPPADLWWTEASGCVIRRLVGGTVETMAGTPGRCGYEDGPAGLATFNQPGQVVRAVGDGWGGWGG